MSTYIFYGVTLLISLMFLSLSTSKRLDFYLRKICAFLGMIFPCFIMGTRNKTGVDDIPYEKIFENVRQYGLLHYYEDGRSTEPGYVLINYIVDLLGGSFHWVIFVCAVIFCILIYKIFEYESDKISMGWMFFVFFTMQYFYYVFGIMRLSLGVTIGVYGLRFLMKGNRKKFILTTLMATTCHYSALILFVLIPLTKWEEHTPEELEREEAFKKRGGFKQKHGLRQGVLIYRRQLLLAMLVAMPVAFLLASKLIIPLLPPRYWRYAGNKFILSIGSVLDKLPLLILFTMAEKRLIELNKHNELYLLMFKFSFIMELYSKMLSITRVNWYFWLGMCFLIPSFFKCIKKFYYRMIYMMGISAYCLYYMTHAYFIAEQSRSVLVPFRSVFFELAN